MNKMGSAGCAADTDKRDQSPETTQLLSAF